MPDHQKMYDLLFNSITDTIERLKTARQKAEDGSMEAAEDGESPDPPPAGKQ